MLTFISFSAVFLVIGLYTSLGARAYRDPRLVLLAGLLASAVAAAVKGYLIRFKTLPGSPFTPEELDIAAAIVDPTLVGLAGGLIAAAFMTRMHFLYAEDQKQQKKRLARAQEYSHAAARADDELRLVAYSLSDNEFRERLAIVKEAQYHSALEQTEVESRLRSSKLPGSD